MTTIDIPRRLATMCVADAMASGLISCPPEMPLRLVAGLMADENVHAVAVAYDGEHGTGGAWGMVTDLDLIAAARGEIGTLTARDAAVSPLITVRTTDALERAARLLAESGASHLAVIDAHSERPVGVLSTHDIARAIAGISA